MSEEIIDSGANTPSGERPTFLTVLCILSFIAAGLTALFAVLAVIAAGAIIAGAENAGATVTSSGGIGWLYVIIVLAIAAVSLYGVIKMWKLQKVGFTIYTAAAAAGVLAGIIFVGFDIVGLVITAAFVVMYYLNLKHMH